MIEHAPRGACWLALALALTGLAACSTPKSEPAAVAQPAKPGVAAPAAPPPGAAAAPRGEPLMCTMDARRCPDGSYVSRNAARNCEFNPCPGK